jgi:hypothetical protein
MEKADHKSFIDHIKEKIILDEMTK